MSTRPKSSVSSVDTLPRNWHLTQGEWERHTNYPELGIYAGVAQQTSWTAFPRAQHHPEVKGSESGWERDVTCVAGQLAAYSDVAFARFQVVNGTNVIEATAGHVVSGRGVRTGHDPRGTQRDGMDLAKRRKN